MQISIKEYKEIISEHKKELNLIKEQRNKIKQSLKSKKQELTQCRNNFYQNFIHDEDENILLSNNQNFLNKIYEQFKETNKLNKQKGSIDLRIKQLKGQNAITIQKLSNEIKNITSDIEIQDKKIFKLDRELHKMGKEDSFEYDSQNYIINPTYEYIIPISELSLCNQVQRRLQRLLNYNKQQNIELEKEIANYSKGDNHSNNKKEDAHKEKQENSEEDSEEDEGEGEESEDEEEEEKNDNNSLKPVSTKDKEDKLNIFKKKSKNYEQATNLEKIEEKKEEYEASTFEVSPFEKLSKTKINSIPPIVSCVPIKEEKECLSSESSSIVIDSTGLSQKIFDNLLESPRFVDKIINNTTKIKPIQLMLDSSLKSNNLASTLKIKHVNKKEEQMVMIEKQIQTSDLTIKELREQLEIARKLNAQIIKKKNKIKDNLQYTENRINIISDQIDLVKHQIEELENEEDNNNTNNSNKGGVSSKN